MNSCLRQINIGPSHTSEAKWEIMFTESLPWPLKNCGLPWPLKNCGLTLTFENCGLRSLHCFMGWSFKSNWTQRERERKYALKLKRKNFTCRVSFLPWPVSPENWFRNTSSYRRHCIDRVWVQISQKEYNCASYK